MKKHVLFAISIGLSLYSEAQAPPINTNPTNAGESSYDFWSRAGNSSAGNNYFGTKYNSPIYTVTGNGFPNGNTFRTKLNAIFTGLSDQYSINGFSWTNGVNTTGYMLLGPNNGDLYQKRGAFSLLHLNGQTVGSIQEFGYRPWMKTGITFTDNSDLSYFGMRQVGTGPDITETAIVWSDNASSPYGPDDITFRYTQGGLAQGAGTTSLNFADQEDYDGLQVFRLTGDGLAGLGNTFGVNVPGPATNYIRPQSLMHMSYQFRAGTAWQPYGFQQITYRRPNGASSDIIGQGETANDGLRFGIDNTVFSNGAQQYLNSYLRWQEASSFIIQTEDDGTANIAQNERLRITSIGALLANYSGINYFGLTNSTNATRISISESGSIPLTRPKSLLHLGYDYGNLTGSLIQGYRKWMDLGVLTSNNKDHVWLGLKPRTELTTTVPADYDLLDAVVAWGTDRQASSPTQVDKLRFIFTGYPFEANPDNAPSTSTDGLEMMRMYPATVYTHTVYNANGNVTSTVNSYGRVGIGDFTAQGVNEEPTQKLDVVGNGRFRYLPDSTYIADSTVHKYVMVDETGVLRWGKIPTGVACWDTNGNGIQDSIEDINGDGHWNALDCQGSAGNATIGAHNGTSISTIDTTKVSLGQDLNDPNAPGQLLSTREIPLNGNKVLFTGVGQIGVGTAFTNPAVTPLAKVDVRPNAIDPVGIRVENTNNMSVQPVYDMNIMQNDATGTIVNTGLFVLTRGNPVKMACGINAQSNSTATPINIGVIGSSLGGYQSNVGGRFSASVYSPFNTGINGYGNSADVNQGAEFRGGNPGDVTSTLNRGAYCEAIGGQHAIGVYGTANSATLNHAGYFNGNVEAINGTFISDQQFKTNVTSIVGGLKLVGQLNPVKYDFDITGYPQFNFDSREHLGFIAQEVANVLPDLVYDSEMPAQYDSLGNIVTPATTYKSLNYNGLIPVNTQAIIELNQKVEKATLSDQSIKANVQDLTGSLNKVLNMRGVSYDWNHTVHPELNLDSANHIGFIAQEMQQVDARLTYVSDDSLLHVEYDKVVPILAEAIQELNNEVQSKDSIINVLISENDAQQTTIDDLNNRLSQLENCLSGILPYLCQLSQSAIQANTPQAQDEIRAQLSVRLTNKEAIVLDQNVPNPFAEQTVINFSIPESVKKAQIHFYNGMGQLMQSVEVTERGLGSLTVFGSDLSNGTYTYTLVADGQIVATKKMVKQ